MGQFVTISEPTLNILLAQLLEQRGLRAVGEVVLHSGAFRPDIFMTVSGVRVILEGRFQRPGVEDSLDATCRERIQNALCDISVAVVYPRPQLAQLSASTKAVRDALASSTYKAKVFHIGSTGIQAGGWEENIELDQLSSLIRSSYNQVVTTDRVKDTVDHLAGSLNEFTEQVSRTSGDIDSLAEQLMDAMDLPKQAPQGQDPEDDDADEA